MKRIASSLWAGMIVLLACACASTPTPQPTATPTTIGAKSVALPQVIALPTPQLKGKVSLEETLAQRRSVREFSDDPLTLDEIGQLMWAAQGITSPAGQRTAPSAGALYPLEVYIVLRDGVYHYEPAEHQLRLRLRGDAKSALFVAALEQGAVASAPATIVIAAVYARTAIKYGDERTPRYVHLEAGHAAQNILLQAVALNLGAVPIGAFYDDQVKLALNLPSDHEPVYVIPVGRRK